MVNNILMITIFLDILYQTNLLENYFDKKSIYNLFNSSKEIRDIVKNKTVFKSSRLLFPKYIKYKCDKKLNEIKEITLRHILRDKFYNNINYKIYKMIYNHDTYPLVINMKSRSVHYYNCKKVGYLLPIQNIVWNELVLNGTTVKMYVNVIDYIKKVNKSNKYAALYWNNLYDLNNKLKNETYYTSCSCCNVLNSWLLKSNYY